MRRQSAGRLCHPMWHAPADPNGIVRPQALGRTVSNDEDGVAVGLAAAGLVQDRESGRRDA